MKRAIQPKKELIAGRHRSQLIVIQDLNEAPKKDNDARAAQRNEAIIILNSKFQTVLKEINALERQEVNFGKQHKRSQLIQAIKARKILIGQMQERLLKDEQELQKCQNGEYSKQLLIDVKGRNFSIRQEYNAMKTLEEKKNFINSNSASNLYMKSLKKFTPTSPFLHIVEQRQRKAREEQIEKQKRMQKQEQIEMTKLLKKRRFSLPPPQQQSSSSSSSSSESSLPSESSSSSNQQPSRSRSRHKKSKRRQKSRRKKQRK